MIVYRTPLRRMNIMQVDEDTYRASGKHRLGIWMLLNRLTCKIVQRGVDRNQTPAAILRVCQCWKVRRESPVKRPEDSHIVIESELISY